MRNLLVGSNHFGELRKTIQGISQKVLMDNLRSMEQDCIIIRTVYAEVPPRVEYKLSELGETMRPIISAMETWGPGYQEIVRSNRIKHTLILCSVNWQESLDKYKQLESVT